MCRCHAGGSVSSVLDFFLFRYNPNCVVAPVCSSGPDERLKVTAATPAVVSGVIAVFYGSGLIALQVYTSFLGWKKFGQG